MTTAERMAVLLGLGGVVTTTWGTELILARITSVPQIPADALQSLLGLTLIAALLGGPALLIRRKPVRRCLLALAALAPVLVVMGGLLGPALDARNQFVIGASASSVAVVCAWRLFEAWRGGDPFGRAFPWLAVTAAAFGAWASRSQSMPPLTLLASFVILGGVLVVLPRLSGGLAVSVLYGLCAGLWPAGAPQTVWSADTTVASGPDIVLISVDTLRADDAESMRSYQRLAAEGVRFTRAQSASSWTLPAMTTLHTGATAADPASDSEAARLVGLAEVETLATRLAAAGYDTAAVIADNPLLGRALGFDRGYTVFDSANAAGLYALPTGPREPTVGRPVVARWVGQPGPASSYAGSLAGRALHIVQRRRDRPIFLWIHFLGPHPPYRFAGELDAVQALPADLARDLRVLTGLELVERHAWLGTEEGRKLLRSVYRNEIARVDDAILAILDGLASARLRRERVVLLTSDHGEELFERGELGHGRGFYQEVVGIPLVVSGLGGGRSDRVGAVEPAVVGHVDIAPTLLAAAGIRDPALAGRDLSGEIEPQARVSRGLMRRASQPGRYAVRDVDWKLVVEGDEEVRLYDLAADPGEQRDVAAQHPEIVAGLAAEPLPVASSRPAEVALDDGLRRALRALGYFDARRPTR